RIDEVDFGAVQIADADRIHEQPDAVRFEHLVARPLAVLFDHQAVLETRTAAALHEDAKAAAGFLLFGEGLGDLGCCRFGDIDHVAYYNKRWRTWRFWAENGPTCTKRPSDAGRRCARRGPTLRRPWSCSGACSRSSPTSPPRSTAAVCRGCRCRRSTS